MDDPLQIAKKIIEESIRTIKSGSADLRNGCVECHTIFTSQQFTNE